MPQEYWDKYWANQLTRLGRDNMWTQSGEQWLEPYLDFLRLTGVARVLEVGCGAGIDTRFLTDSGFQVTATDYSMEALTIAKSIAGPASFVQHDTQEPFPFENGRFDLVVASLSLHYFDADASAAIVDDLARLLRPGGLLLYRMNSAGDPKAGQRSSDLPRYYYTEAMCRELFAAWETLMLTERTNDYLGHTKLLWEGLVKKRGAADHA